MSGRPMCCYREREVICPPSATSSFVIEIRAMGTPLGSSEPRRGGQADDLVAMQGFKKGLNAAADEAPHSPAVDLHLTHP